MADPKNGEKVKMTKKPNYNAFSFDADDAEDDLLPKVKPTQKKGKALKKTVEIDLLVPNVLNKFHIVEDEKFEQLQGNMEKEGVTTIIRVKPENEDGKYVIISGERRWRAAKKAGITHIEVIITQDYEKRSEEIGAITRANGGGREENPYDIALMLKLFYEALAEESENELSSAEKKDAAMDAFQLKPRSLYNYDRLVTLPEDILLLGQARLITRDAGLHIAEVIDASKEKAQELISGIRAVMSNEELDEKAKKAALDALIYGRKAAVKKEKPATVDAFKTIKKAQNIFKDFELTADENLVLPKQAAKKETLVGMCDKLIEYATRCKAMLEESKDK